MSEAAVDVRDAPTPPISPSIGSTSGIPATSGGGTVKGGGGSTGPALLALLALLSICARRRNMQYMFAARR
jgi:hypothetical protein